MKDIAKKLITGEIDTLQALFLAREKATGDLRIFVDNELDGYPLEGKLPEYRKFSCPVVLDYQTPWGDIHREVELDTKLLIEKGFSVNTSLVYDDYPFIQDNTNSLSGNTGIRPFNSHLLEMLSNVVVANHPNSKIIGGGHKFQKTQLQSILDSVKRVLIKKLQDTSQANETLIKNDTQPEALKKTVFVSYAWENGAENNKVISFVNFLREKGYDARMDKYISQQQTATNFKRMMHDGMYNSDKVVVILSEKYKAKADNLEDGVSEELKIIQEEIAKQPNKYVLVSFIPLTKEQISKILPHALVDRDIFDLKRDQDEREFAELFAKLNNVAIVDFSDVAESTPETKKIKIDPFKL